MSRLLVCALLVCGCSSGRHNSGDGGSVAAQLSSLPGGLFTYYADREWGRQDSSAVLSDDPIPDSAYQAIAEEARYTVLFATDATNATLTPVEPSDPSYTATREAADAQRWSYAIAQWAGGRFAVWPDGARVAAELTIFGSGIRVVESSRGELRRVTR